MNAISSKRHRGFVLNPVGWQKLQTKIDELEVCTGRRHTHSSISRCSQLVDPQGLHPTTVRKILQRQTGVDERSLQMVFRALDLDLDLYDYTPFGRDEGNDPVVEPNMASAGSPILNPLDVPEFPGMPLPLESRFYIPHSEIQALALQEIQHPGSLLRIRAPQRMGKSSFLLRVLHDAEMQGYTLARIDFQQADEAVFSSLERFLRWLCSLLSYQLQLQPPPDEAWDEQVGSKVNCTLYLQRYILQQISGPVVLSLNEVNLLLEHPIIFQEFLPLLRSWHEEARYNELFQKLRLVLVYATESYGFLKLHQSPFNVGLPIELPELSPEQVQRLVEQYPWTGQAEIRSLSGVQALMALVGGHPYLIQLALYHLWRGNVGLAQLLDQAPTSLSIYHNHLCRCLEKLEADPVLQSAFQQVLGAGETPLPLVIAYQLEGMGLVRLTGTGASIRCNLYQQYFQTYFARLSQYHRTAT
ncbi:MAG TPA: AAA-like domain-containing protein [Coleofasciculaceae cyanobacterium]